MIGFLVYFAMFGFAIWQASRIVLGRPDGEFEWLGPIAIALFNFVLIKSVFASTENHSLIFVLLGMVVALSYRWSHAKSAPPSFPEMAARPSGSPSLSPR